MLVAIQLYKSSSLLKMGFLGPKKNLAVGRLNGCATLMFRLVFSLFFFQKNICIFKRICRYTYHGDGGLCFGGVLRKRTIWNQCICWECTLTYRVQPWGWEVHKCLRFWVFETYCSDIIGRICLGCPITSIGSLAIFSRAMSEQKGWGQ